MPHVAVDVNRLAHVENHGIVELREDFDAAFENIYIFFAGVVHEGPELLCALRAYACDDRDHAFAAQFGAEVVIVVVLRVDAHRVFGPADAAASGHGGGGHSPWGGEQTN